MESMMKTYKGSHYHRKPNTKYNKVVVFDIDETFGHFPDLKVLWNYLISNDVKYATQHNFNTLLDLFPEFIRHGILPIIDYIYKRKMKRECHKICVYTNNQFEKEWVDYILTYLSYKLDCKTPLFDKVIYAFTPSKNHSADYLNRDVEQKRTMRVKSYNDFINCTVLSKPIEMCFIDNTFFPDMKNTYVYYIQPMSYNHDLSKDEIMMRFLHSKLWVMNFTPRENREDTLKHELQINQPYVKMKKTDKTAIDLLVAKKIMYHVKEFFYFPSGKNKTRKYVNMIQRFTRKNNGNSA